MPNPELSKKRLSSCSTLLLTFVLLAMASGLPLGAQSAGEKGGPGLDLFRTDPKTSFSFTGDFAIPAGFFGEGSGRYSGTVNFKGVPLGSFRDHKTGKADTVIERKSTPAAAAKFPSESKTEIEIAALSLQSTQPIKVRAGKKTELWDVKVGLSTGHPSTGSMTFVQRSAKGGSATSEFTVYPLFTFVRRGDKAEKTLDTGTQKLAEAGTKHITLKASNIPWTRTTQTSAASLSNGIAVGAANLVIIHRAPGHSHFVTPIQF
ncbi:MAG TPA: hypothetical protein VLX28_05675 [Thermoanaerobaculia bacterium]|nr:hypothetical protein [Thermoanaerobaculia bacterium]